MAMMDKLQQALVDGFKRREMQASAAAQYLADNSEAVSKALRLIDPKMETAVLALVEVAEFQKELRHTIQAIAGHAAEGAELAQSHATDMRDVATLAINMDQIVASTPYRLEHAGDVHVVVEKLIEELTKAVEAGKPLKVGLVIRED